MFGDICICFSFYIFSLFLPFHSLSPRLIKIDSVLGYHVDVNILKHESPLICAAVSLCIKNMVSNNHKGSYSFDKPW